MKSKPVHTKESPAQLAPESEVNSLAKPLPQKKDLSIQTNLTLTKEGTARKKREYKPRTLPTRKQESFAQEYIKNKFNGTQAVLKTYNTTNTDTAKAIAYENLTKPYLVNRIDQLLNENDLSLNVCVHRLSKQTTAKKKVQLGLKVHQVPDNSTINDALKTAFKLHRVLSDSNVNIDARSINLGLDSLDYTALQGISDTLKDMNANLSMGNVQSGEVIDVDAT